MALTATPNFAVTPHNKVSSVSTANTARDGTGTIVDIFDTVPAAGSKILQINVHATADPADCILTLFVHNGTSWFILDEVDLDNPSAASTTVPGFHFERDYSKRNLNLPSGWKLGAAITVALTSGVLHVTVFGADFT